MSLALLLVAGLAFVPALLLAVHDTTFFELDGDATSGAHVVTTLNTGVEDWDKVCKEVTKDETTPLCTGANDFQDPTKVKAVAWTTDNIVGDGASTNATLFTTGGSKDPQNISAWRWKDGAGGLPDKDNLTHAFAIRYSLPVTATCPSADPTCEVLYFGSNRFDNSGDAQQGFWFFKNPVGVSYGPDTNGDGTPDTPCPLAGGGQDRTFCNPQTGGPAVHATGDILVISDFSNGGTHSEITIYKWDPACLKDTTGQNPPGDCGDANLRKLTPTLTDITANCATTGSADQACGLVNPSTITMPWPFLDKSGTTNNQAIQGEFLEAGLNLSSLHLGDECFSSIAAETRSSTSTTATLKDFVIAGFGNCSPNLTTKASTNGSVSPGTAVRDLAKIQVTGATSPADATGTISFAYCYSADPLVVPTCTSGASGNITSFGSAVTLDNLQCDPDSPNGTDGLSCALSVTVNDSQQTGARGPLAPGNYCFLATASLTNYANPAEYTDQTDECFNVLQLQPTMTTAQTWTVKDSATITVGTGGGNLAGNVRFQLFRGTDCSNSSTELYNSGTIAVSGALSVTKSTDDATSATGSLVFTGTPQSTPTGTLRWKVTYTSTNNAHKAVTHACGSENTVLTIDNDGTANTP